MSDEQRRDDEIEVEGHAYPRVGANDEPAEDGETEVEAHVQSRYRTCGWIRPADT